MRVLLDECVTRYLARDFQGHDVLTVDQAGLKGLKNGQLLLAAGRQFDVLITVDQNLKFQQNLANFDLAVVVLRAERTTYSKLRPLMPQVLQILATIEPGQVVVIEKVTTR